MLVTGSVVLLNLSVEQRTLFQVTHPLFMLLSLIPASAPAKRSPAPTAAAAGPAARGRRVEGGAGQSSRWREMAGAQVWGLLGQKVYVPVQGEV